MIFENHTPYAAAWTLAFQRDGRELVVVVVKATYQFSPASHEPTLAAEQLPLIDADEFTGEPGRSAPLYETDFAPRKPACDLLLNGTAYAPRGVPAERVRVGMQLDGLHKSFDVVGNRHWQAGLLHFLTSPPERFTVMPISYDKAFGGVDELDEDPRQHRWYPTNHAGVGYSETQNVMLLKGKPLPNTEETGRPVTTPHGRYRPMAFGPLGRAWQPRVQFAGTYDQKWIENQSPFWPDDFDERYFQAAPSDQQVPHLRGGESVVLTNLTPEGETRITVPSFELPIVLVPVEGEPSELETVIDTLLLEPDLRRMTLTRRATLPMRRSCFDVREMHIGLTLRDYRRRQDPEKTRYANLAEAIKGKS